MVPEMAHLPMSVSTVENIDAFWRSLGRFLQRKYGTTVEFVVMVQSGEPQSHIFMKYYRCQMYIEAEYFLFS